MRHRTLVESSVSYLSGENFEKLLPVGISPARLLYETFLHKRKKTQSQTRVNRKSPYT
ncbi:hypothetical protein Hanom_Chr05g00399221 [Helianthus anomalus]